LKELNILSVSTPDDLIRFTAFAADSVISSKRNLIVLIDTASSDTIVIDMVPV